MSQKKRAIYAGTFDPFTNGHLDIVNRGLQVFDEIVVLMAISPSKNHLVPTDQRLKMVEDVFKDFDNVVVDSCNGLIVDYAKDKDIDSILRGLRPTGDFESEFQMATMNQKLYGGIETFFLMTGSENYFISSSLVKEIFLYGRDISGFVPATIAKVLEKYMK